MTDAQAERLIELLCGDFDKANGWWGGLKGIQSALASDDPGSIKEKLENIHSACDRIADALESLVDIADRNTPN